MEIKANRLVLRYWTIEDAPALFEEAQNPKVGPKAGWPAHCTLSDSQQVIQDVLMNNQTFAIVHYGDNKIIGSIGYFEPRVSEYPVLDSSYEIGYWIGEPYWGQGYGPEAARALISYLFEHRSAEEIWGGFMKEIPSHIGF